MNKNTITIKSNDPTAYIPVTIKGRALWRAKEVGPRGGQRYIYTARSEGQTAPNPYALWSDRAKDVESHHATPAGSGVGYRG